jgi:hypothetical protein
VAAWCLLLVLALAERWLQIRERFSERRESVMSTPTGSEAPLRVTFREVDPFDLWVWARIPANASSDDKELLGEVFKAWFILGKLGGFNALKLHVQRHADAGATSVSNMAYVDDASEADAALFHAMGDCEFKDNWMRCWWVAVQFRSAVCSGAPQV